MRQFYTVELTAKVVFTQYVRADNLDHAIKRGQDCLRTYFEDMLRKDEIKTLRVSKIKAKGELDQKEKIKCV